MRKLYAIFLISVTAFAIQAHSQQAPPLRLIQRIPMPGVQGRLDHLGTDIPGKRLFVSALGENQNTLEDVDLQLNKRVFSIPGQSKPQGVFYSPGFKKLFVANGTDGTCKIFAGDPLKLIGNLSIGTDADHVGYDTATKYLYVGVGDANSGALSVTDTRTNRHIEDIKTDARPGGIKIEKGGSRIFVTLAGATKLGVVDRKTREESTTWPVSGVQDIVALALDESHHRLFGGTRNPPTLTVLDTESGKAVTQLEGVPGIDDLWYDATHGRVYASGGRGFDVGFVYVYQQKNADQYELLGKVPTAPGAGTSLWAPEFDRYYVAAPASENQEAAVLVFEPQK
jgi:DNA-binding beta-propeller fold protein YncE